jgi:hypothetical protein
VPVSVLVAVQLPVPRERGTHLRSQMRKPLRLALLLHLRLQAPANRGAEFVCLFPLIRNSHAELPLVVRDARCDEVSATIALQPGATHPFAPTSGKPTQRQAHPQHAPAASSRPRCREAPAASARQASKSTTVPMADAGMRLCLCIMPAFE